MESGRKPDDSSSHLMGAKDFNANVSSSMGISSPAKGIFDSVFSPPLPLTVVGRDLSHSELIDSWAKQESVHHVQKTEDVSPGSNSQRPEGEGQTIPNKHGSSIFKEETIGPCSLSSSIYYGGPDICSNSPNTQVSGSPHFVLYLVWHGTRHMHIKHSHCSQGAPGFIQLLGSSELRMQCSDKCTSLISSVREG